MDLIAVCGANYFLKRRKKYRRLIPAAAVTSFLGACAAGFHPELSALLSDYAIFY